MEPLSSEACGLHLLCERLETGASCLLALPLKIKRAIFSHLFDMHNNTINLHNRSRFHITHTNRQLFREACDGLWLHTDTMAFPSIISLLDFTQCPYTGKFHRGPNLHQTKHLVIDIEGKQVEELEDPLWVMYLANSVRRLINVEGVLLSIDNPIWDYAEGSRAFTRARWPMGVSCKVMMYPVHSAWEECERRLRLEPQGATIEEWQHLVGEMNRVIKQDVKRACWRRRL